MAFRCEICGRHSVAGHNVSHSERKTPRRWHPNIQKGRIVVDGQSVRVSMCTRCMRTLAKAERVS